MKRLLTLKVADVTDFNDEQIESLKLFLLAGMNKEKRNEARFHVLTTDDAENIHVPPSTCVIQVFPLDGKGA